MLALPDGGLSHAGAHEVGSIVSSGCAQRRSGSTKGAVSMFGRELIERSFGLGWRNPSKAALSGALVATLATCLLAPAVAAARSKPVSLHAGTVTLTFTARTFAALTKSTTGPFADTRTVSTVAPGVAASSGVFKFPLASGKVNVQKLTGQVASKGGLNFQSTSTLPVLGSSTSQFELTSFALHFGSGPLLSGTFVGSSATPNAPLATLSTSHAKHAKHGRAVTISGLVLKLTSSGAQVFNGQDNVFKVGQEVGTASVSATT
jgi:hypothetical protein